MSCARVDCDTQGSQRHCFEQKGSASQRRHLVLDDDLSSRVAVSMRSVARNLKPWAQTRTICGR